ncbi:MAG: 50S ribosomal protein L10 [Endomicrobium sp.]|jgi:large subunit ribosomal protein L10|nr:50S ribosomal protein L10 [Endomicrobium sp.]
MSDLKKQKIVSSLIQQFKTMKGFVITEYKGLNVKDVAILREQLTLINSKYIVVKNSLAKIALKRIDINIDNRIFVGPIAIIINKNDDIIPMTKFIVKFTNIYKEFKVKVAFLDGIYMNQENIKQLSCIDSKEVLMINVINSLKMPIVNLIYVLTNNINRFIMLIKLKSQTN